MRALRFSNFILLYFVLVLLLGGASAAGLLSNALLQIAGAILLGACIFVRDPAGQAWPSGLKKFVIALAVLAAIQLLPLPPIIWSHLPGRAPIVHGFAILGQPLPFLPVSLSPWATIAAFVWWLPAFALLTAMLRSDAPSPSLIVTSVVIIAILSAAIGAIQRAGGDLYFYQITNFGLATGFFANANHQAAFLLAALVMAGAQHAAQRSGQRADRRKINDVLFAGVALLLVFGIFLSNSLAVIGLLAPVLGGVGLMFFPYTRLSRGIVMACVAVAAASIIGALLYVWLGGNVAHDSAGSFERFLYLRRSLPIARDTFPFGSGLGTFVQVYDWYETSATIEFEFVNHAHDDLLELLIDAGIPGLIVLTMFGRWWLGRTLVVWREYRDNSYMLAGTLLTGAMLAHSLVDYPLRTAALSGLFAAGCGLMVRSHQNSPGRKRRGSTKALEKVAI